MNDRDGAADLATAVDELRDTLDELQVAVGDERSTPGPPRPRELLRFTESYTIPTLVALLEAAIQSLELLGATLRLVDGRGLETWHREGSGDTASRVGSVGRATVDRVDAALGELTAALEGEPPEGEARDLLREARALREDIDDRLGAAGSDRGHRTGSPGDERQSSAVVSGDGHQIPVTTEAEPEPDPEAEDVDPPTVDVDAELASIREEVADERERSAEWSAEPDPSDPESAHDDGAGEK